MQVGGLYLIGLILCLSAFVAYALMAVLMHRVGAPISTVFCPGGFAAAALLMLTSPFMLAFLPLMVCFSCPSPSCLH